MQNKIILGIDPGYGRVGFAVIEKSKTGDILLHSECFETNQDTLHPNRLLLIIKRVGQIIKKYKPQKAAIETLLWSKNKKTALQVAEARGAILCELAKHNLLICEYNPNQIKLAVTGYGKSDKKQIINMLPKLINIKNGEIKRLDDEYDAIAVAITCSATFLSTEKVF